MVDLLQKMKEIEEMEREMREKLEREVREREEEEERRRELVKTVEHQSRLK